MVSAGAFGVVYNQLADGFSCAGEYLLTPDIASLRTLPFEPNTVGLMGRFEEKALSSGPNGNMSFEVDLCPRTVLDQIVKYVSNVVERLVNVRCLGQPET